eukprot:COSAG06_NODE_59580_length_273_cov_2.660920_1_plen_54_part_01
MNTELIVLFAHRDPDSEPTRLHSATHTVTVRALRRSARLPRYPGSQGPCSAFSC